MKSAVSFAFAVLGVVAILAVYSSLSRKESLPVDVRHEIGTASPLQNERPFVELTSGLQPGDLVPPFDVEKCGGAVNDGKEIGANFCYRCMLGNKPVVMVFSQSADEQLAMLVKALDKEVVEHDDQKLSAFVNLIGPNQDALKTTAKQFVATNAVENVALVVPHEFANGPADMELNPAADVTVTIYRNGKVSVSHAIPEGGLTSQMVQTILADTGKILD